MAAKQPKVGMYGPKTRALQETLSFEHVSLSWKTGNLWKYLGSRTNDNPSINDIQNTTFLEVPDRAYDAAPIEINLDYEPLPEQMTDLSQFGIYDPTQGQQVFKVHTKSYEDIGRQVIEGDVIEIPFLQQDGKGAYFEVTDVDRKQEFEHYYAIVTARPLSNSRATEEIPTDNTNSDIFDQISNDVYDSAEADVQDEGLDTSDTTTDDEQSGDTYDPKGGSLLDDPNATF